MSILTPTIEIDGEVVHPETPEAARAVHDKLREVVAELEDWNTIVPEAAREDFREGLDKLTEVARLNGRRLELYDYSIECGKDRDVAWGDAIGRVPLRREEES